MEEGKGQGGLATSHQYGNALLGVCYQEEEIRDTQQCINEGVMLNKTTFSYFGICIHTQCSLTVQHVDVRMVFTHADVVVGVGHLFILYV